MLRMLDITKKVRRVLRTEGFEPKHWSIKLIGIMVVVYILQLSIPAVTQYGSLYPPEIAGRPWTLLTAAFLHAPRDFGQHLLYNMFALFIFGTVLEAIIGSRRFLLLFFAAAIAASIAGIIAYPDVPSLGASGAIMGVIGTLAVLRPKLMVWFGGPVPLIVAAAIWALIDLAGLFSPVQTGIGNAAHLAGMGLGIVFGFAWRKEFAPLAVARRRAREFMSDEEVYG